MRGQPVNYERLANHSNASRHRRVQGPYRACASHRLSASVKKKWTLKNTIVLEAQFGLVLNWAFIAQGGRRSLVIEVMYILVQ